MAALLSPRDRRCLRLVALFALALLGLFLLVKHLPAAWAGFWYPERLIGPQGRLLPQEWLWGVYPITYLPGWLRWAAIAMTAGVVIWAGFGRIGRFDDRLRSLKRIGFPHSAWVQIALAGLSFPVFWLGRVVHTRWGDAYLLVNGIAHPDVRLLYNWQAPLDTFVHALLFRLGERWWGWQDALPAYWWLSSLAGVGAVWVLLRLADEIGRTPLERWTVFGLIATLGSIQLFFGYPENYTLISLLILAFLWLGWRFAHGQTSLWAPGIVLALANGFHPATLVLQPSLWALAFAVLGRRNLGLHPGLRSLAALIVPPLAVGVGVVALMSSGGHGLAAFVGAEAPGGGDHRWLVPLFTVSSSWEYYTMFSRGHLLDVINQQILVMPFTLPLLLILVIGYRSHLPRDPFAWFLLIAGASYVLLTWLWNPDYGGQRDWDLFSVAAWPATLWAAYWLTRALNAPTLARALLIILPVQALHTVAWVFSNTRPWEWPV
ncbi:MAG: hypothetical protein K1X65_19105 [Caldilineales bacterium]|nr:hypothetical protein [Caldilineales bacterium]MCW5859892.1 hypothetical protein [Caldilineales bacterium]